MCKTCPFRNKKESREKILERVYLGDDNISGWIAGECHCRDNSPCEGITDEEHEKYSKLAKEKETQSA